jgi:Arc/MetJ-type ribon-helix-helix transcriptional regulator
MNISVSEEMHRWIREGMRAGFHSSVSEYIRTLVRRDRNPPEKESTAGSIEDLRTANDYLRTETLYDE